MSGRRKTLLVFDLNGTLLHSTYQQHQGLIHDGLARNKYVYFRPYMREFFDFVFENFDVAVWTSHIRPNASALVKLAFGAMYEKELKFIYARDECIVGEGHTSQKPLQRIWKQFRQYDNTNTFIVDDSTEKLLPEQRCNHILIETYTADPESQAVDNGLQRLERLLKSDYLPE